LSEVKVLRHTRLKTAQGVPLAFGDTGDVLLFQSTRFPGKLLVSAFGFERDQTSWPVHLSFLPFLDLALQHCRAAGEDRDMFEAGESSVIPLPRETTASQVVLGAARFPVSEGKAQIKVPDKPGVYELRYDNSSAAPRMLAVNPPPRESELSYTANPEAPTVWAMQKSPDNRPPAAASIMELSRSEILRQRWWWWLALGVVALLAIEMLWSSARKAQV
jgi:hypothetical protein